MVEQTIIHCAVETPHAEHDWDRYYSEKHCPGVPLPEGSEERYIPEVLGDEDDDGTMVKNVKQLGEEVIGHKIVKVEKRAGVKREYWGAADGHVLTLDNGTEVILVDGGDCCAVTELQSFLVDPQGIDHVITGVGTTEGYTKWHIYSEAQDALELRVNWSAGNPFYYGYGFDIAVKPVDGELKWKERYDD